MNIVTASDKQMDAIGQPRAHVGLIMVYAEWRLASGGTVPPTPTGCRAAN